MKTRLERLIFSLDRWTTMTIARPLKKNSCKPKKTRSLLNIAMISSLNRNHELGMHVKGAIRNGCTKDEIREVLLQVAIYCGVPAAVDSFRVAKAALAELEAE